MTRPRSGVGTHGALIAVCAMALVPAHAWAWGCEGHRTVVRIAARHLSIHAQQQLRALLTANPIDSGLKRFCQPVSPDPFIDAATWADDIRDPHPETGGWHFMDIPRSTPRDQAKAACPPSSCVTTAIAQQLKVLRSNAADAARADALRFIIHFVGDMHQPLHCTTNNDRGGNCVPVRFFDKPPVLQKGSDGKPVKGKYKPNLHSVWDSSIIAADVKARGITLWQFADDLDKKFSAQIPAWMAANVRLEDWAWESHQVAETVAYGKLGTAVPQEVDTHPATCDDANHVAERMLGLDQRLDQPYQDDALPVVHEQLAKAGARLAKILNRVWP